MATATSPSLSAEVGAGRARPRARHSPRSLEAGESRLRRRPDTGGFCNLARGSLARGQSAVVLAADGATRGNGPSRSRVATWRRRREQPHALRSETRVTAGSRPPVLRMAAQRRLVWRGVEELGRRDGRPSKSLSPVPLTTTHSAAAVFGRLLQCAVRRACHSRRPPDGLAPPELVVCSFEAVSTA